MLLISALGDLESHVKDDARLLRGPHLEIITAMVP